MTREVSPLYAPVSKAMVATTNNHGEIALDWSPDIRAAIKDGAYTGISGCPARSKIIRTQWEKTDSD